MAGVPRAGCVGGVGQGLQDPQPHVRWAACQALGQMCTDLGPQLQEQQHAAIVPALLSAMEDFNAPRVQVHSIARMERVCTCVPLC